MTDIWIIGLWMLGTLTIGLVSAIGAKMYGKEVLVGGFLALLIMSNIIASKIVTFGSFLVPAAILAYSSTFLVQDLIAEFYGYEEARKTVWIGFFVNFIVVFITFTTLVWTPAPWIDQNAFDTVLGLVPRVVFASMVGYLISQHWEAYWFCWWKDRFEGKRLWLRNNIVMLTTMFLDTIIFIPLAFLGDPNFPLDTIFELIIGQYVVKVIVGLLDTAFIYMTHETYKYIPEGATLSTLFTKQSTTET